jgi:hypothetical protein
VTGREMRKVVWGLFLIGIGALFLLERFGAIAAIGEWWPLFFVVFGITHLVEGRFGGALNMFLLGGWFLAVTHGWYGLTWTNSWPLALVAVGLGIVVKAVTGEDDGRGKRRQEHREGGAS